MIAVAIIGFGEVGSIFAREFHSRGARFVRVFDCANTAMERASKAALVQTFVTAREAAAETDIVFVSVTANLALSQSR